jgi:hypothetical protein
MERVAVEQTANGRFSDGLCDWCHDFIDPAVSGGFEQIDGGRLVRTVPSPEALHDAAQFARRADGCRSWRWGSP